MSFDKKYEAGINAGGGVIVIGTIVLMNEGKIECNGYKLSNKG